MFDWLVLLVGGRKVKDYAYKHGYWMDRNGRYHKITKMSDEYIVNALSYLIEHALERDRRMNGTYSDHSSVAWQHLFAEANKRNLTKYVCRECVSAAEKQWGVKKNEFFYTLRKSGFWLMKK